MHDVGDVGLRISAPLKNGGNLPQVGDGLHIGGALLLAVAAVQIGPDGGVARAPGQLADMVDVVHHSFERDGRVVHGDRVPEGRDHPDVHGRADDASALGQGLDLPVVELPVVVAQGPAAVVGGQHGTIEDFHRFPERLFGQVAHVEDHAGRLQGFEHGPSPGRQAAGRLGAVGVGTDPVVAQAHDPQALIPPLGHLFGTHDAVRPFHAEDEPQGSRLGIGLPLGQVGVELGPVPHLAEDAFGFHKAVVGQLAHAPCVGDVLGAHAGKTLAHGSDPAVHRDEHEADPAAPQLLEIHHAQAAALLSHAGFGFAYPGDGLEEVPVPFKGVEGDIEVGIDDQHGHYSSGLRALK